MSTLDTLIQEHHAEILELWKEKAHRVAAARGLIQPEFMNMIPSYLSALAKAHDQLGQFTGRRRELVESHLSARLCQGFQLVEVVEEFALLGRCISQMWLAGPKENQPDPADVERLLSELHLASVNVTDTFARHMEEDEQVEKQYKRLIQTIATEALQEGAQPLQVWLRDVLDLIMEAMKTQCAALALYHAETRTLELTASVGTATTELERYACSIDPASFVGQVATGEDTPLSILDAATTELKVSDTLRRSGIHSLLGVRLPPYRRLLGVMYVGLSETRAFTSREARRLESLGQQLTLHLDNAKLYADLRHHIESLREERELREQFVSVLAHDLRGPLATARMSTELLRQHPESLDVRRDLAVIIDRNIDRTERMICDLLDVNRIRAGGRMPLHIGECDMGAITREVVAELTSNYGDRFALDAEPGVIGFWGADELRRALWNLATNAVKHGADQLITITVRRTDRGAQASVHNVGPVISPDDQKHLFEPFRRARPAEEGGPRGWGLGLTLVRGCAEAHGGTIDVQSSAAGGTTFTMDLPLDARPYQPSPA